MMFATVNGITLNYVLEKNLGKPTVVFINSLGSDYRIWEKMLPHFSDYQTLRYDKRGHGLSDAPPAPYSMTDHAKDLCGLLEHLTIDKAILVGISVGGMIALQTALLRPEKVNALVLCDTGAKIGTEESWRERIDAVQQGHMETVAKTVIGRWFTPTFFEKNAAEAQGYFNMLTRTPLEGYMGTCAALRDADLRSSVSALKALVLCGSEDQSTPPSLNQELATLLNAPFEGIDGAGHLPCIEQAEVMSQRILSFLQRNGYV
jgi:3-oxoadipate enol-lactonase